MSKPDSDNQYHVTEAVTPRPIRHCLGVLVFTLVAFLAGAFYALHYPYMEAIFSPKKSQDLFGDKIVITDGDIDYKALYEKSLEDLKLLRQQLTNLQVASAVDDQARIATQQEFVKLQEQLTKLKKQNEFYLSLMSPEDNKRRITIDTPKIIMTNIENMNITR